MLLVRTGTGVVCGVSQPSWMNQHSRLAQTHSLLAPTTHSLRLSSRHKCFRHSLHTIDSNFRRGIYFWPIFLFSKLFGHNVLDIPRHPINDIEPACRTEFAGFEGKDAFNDVDRLRRASEATAGIIQFGANFPSGKKMNHRPATARFLPWLCTTTVLVVGCVPPLSSYVSIVWLPQIASHRLQISSQLRITCSRWKYYGQRVRSTIGGWLPCAIFDRLGFVFIASICISILNSEHYVTYMVL